MKSVRRGAMRWIKAFARDEDGATVPGPVNDPLIVERLDRIEAKIDAVAQTSHGARAAYLGDNRVLMKAVVAGANFAFLLEANDRLITPWFVITGTYETPLTDFLVRELRPDSRCIDAGANFGYYSCLMARFCPSGQVVGVEVDGAVQELARDTVAVNGLAGHARILHRAVSESDAPLTFHRRGTRSANTSLIAYGTAFTEHMGEPAEEPFTVPGITIDEIAATMQGRVDFMKVDIEGAEPLAFRGARRTIAQNPDLVTVMEWSPGQIEAAGFDVSGFLDELAGQGLSFHDMRDDRLTPITAAELLNIPYLFGIVLKRV